MAQSGAEFAEQLEYVAAGRAKSRSMAPLRGLMPFLRPYRWTILAAVAAMLVAATANRGTQVMFEANHDEMVMVRDIALTSMCEHHLVPFMGKAHVAYIPGEDGRVTGLSKLARLVDVYKDMPPIREKIEAGQRLSAADGELLFSPEVDLHDIGELADVVRRRGDVGGQRFAFRGAVGEK